MALPTVPEWLARRDGSLKPGLREFIALVMLGQQPLYRLEVRPAGGQFSCLVTQSNNGKLLDDGQAKYPSREAAFAGGLEALRQKLGW